jgi:hypothetical protein
VLQLRPEQVTRLQIVFSRLAQFAREHIGVTDQEFAEWLLSLSARWLAAHGVSRSNIQLWIARELEQGPQLRPMIAAAETRNDFGGRR